MLQIEKSIQELRENLEKMTNATEGMVRDVKDALEAEDREALEGLFKSDKELDKYEMILDQQAVALLAQINPMATDLRFVFSVIKLTVDLERIGDECKNVAREMRSVKGAIVPELKEMAAKTLDMIKACFTALLAQDTLKAREILLMDDEVDKLEYAIIGKYRDNIGIAFVAKALERIADHATNIAENIVYVMEGIDIRHENSIQNRLGKKTE